MDVQSVYREESVLILSQLVTNPDFAPKVLMVLRHSVAYDEAGPWIEALVAVYNHSTELSVLDLVDIFITQEISTAGMPSVG